MFNIGDKVIVKTPKELENTEGVIKSDDSFVKDDEKSDTFVNEMEELSGKVFTIMFIVANEIKLDDEARKWNWNEWMLKPFRGQLELFDV